MSYVILYAAFQVGVVACICIPATFKAEFLNVVGSIPERCNSPSEDGWIVWPTVI